MGEFNSLECKLFFICKIKLDAWVLSSAYRKYSVSIKVLYLIEDLEGGKDCTSSLWVPFRTFIITESKLVLVRSLLPWVNVLPRASNINSNPNFSSNSLPSTFFNFSFSVPFSSSSSFSFLHLYAPSPSTVRQCKLCPSLLVLKKSLEWSEMCLPHHCIHHT